MHTNLTRIKAIANTKAEHGGHTRRGPHMTHTDLHTYRHQLLDQRQALRERLNQLRGGESSRSEASAAHFASEHTPRAQANTERDVELALDEHESAELRSLDAALQRIEAGSFGRCLDCGCTIPEARLRATPDAARCIDCQRALENSGAG
jgi:DnaK suppressor protein